MRHTSRPESKAIHPFHALPTAQVNGKKTKMSNAGWMALIYPTNEDLPYMYDEFNWQHCR